MAVKAFDLIGVAENIKLKIQCLEASGNDLFLGSSDGVILHYLIEERSALHTDQLIYSSNLLGQKVLGTKKAVIQIKAASALRRLLSLSDGNFYLLDSDTLQTIGSNSKIRNVSAFCVNENPNIADPFTLQFCVGKRKSLQICSLHEDKITLLKEISVQDPPVNLVMDGNYVCVAGSLQYSIYNVKTDHCQDLFPCDPSLTYPYMKRIFKEEFLIMAPGNLGMFVTSAGTSERPPIQWGDGLLALTYYHPYILTMTSSFVKVYSLIDQQHKQTIFFNGGVCMGNFDGQIYITTDNSIYCLMPQPWTSQVLALLENESVNEAVELTEHSGGAGMTASKYLLFSQSIYQKSGFIKLSHGCYHEAQEYFIRGKLDIRELICLFPGLLPSTCEFLRTQPPLHQFVDINQAFQGDKMKISEATSFLFSFLLDIKSSSDNHPYQLELDTAVIKIYSEQNSSQIIDFLDCENIICCLEDCVEILEKHGMYVALSKLYRNVGEIHRALKILTKLLREELKDDSFHGVKEIADFMIRCDDELLIWQYKDIILEANEDEGLRVFCDSKLNLDQNKVLKSLLSYPNARVKYLNHLINVKGSKDEKYHTELVLFYVNELLQNENHTPLQLDYRILLQDLLKNSDLYNFKTVLARIHGTFLLFETATVHGKLGQHEKALSMLIYEVKDLPAAEAYCGVLTRDMPNDEISSVYTTLLKIYLTPAPGASSDDILLAPALQMLSLHSRELDLSQVLDILPSDWSVTIVSQYLKGALRNTMSHARITKLKQGLMKNNCLQTQLNYHKQIKDLGPIHLTSTSICCVCEKNFKSSDFSLYPNGVLTHVECAKNPNVCPLTGQIFKIVDIL